MCEKCARDLDRYLSGQAPAPVKSKQAAPGRSRVASRTRTGPARRATPGRNATGSLALDRALGGGLPHGSLTLVRTQEGAGGVEFAFATLHGALRRTREGHAVFLTGLRSADRARREAAAFLDARAADLIEFEETKTPHEADLDDLVPGDVLVVEDAASIADDDPDGLPEAARALGEAAARRGAIILLLESAGTLEPRVEARLEAHADIVSEFRWVGSGSHRRRTMTLTKMRGLAPALETNTLTFEIVLKSGRGFNAVSITNVA